MVKITSARGLGDALNVRMIVLHHLRNNREVEVYTTWPEIFTDLPVKIRTRDEAVKNTGIDTAATCFQCMVPFVRSISQFRGVCLQAGVYDPIDMDLGWQVRNERLLNDIRRKAGGLSLLFFQPIKKADAGDRPDRKAFANFVNGFSGFCKVKLGHPDFVMDAPEIQCDINLFGKISVIDAIDALTIADVVLCEPSYLGVAAQAFDKRLVCMFSAAAKTSANKRVSGVTPIKIFHKPEISTAVYDSDFL